MCLRHLLLIALVSICLLHRGLVQSQSVCFGANTCDECFQRSPVCAWCRLPSFSPRSRCFDRDDSLNTGMCANNIVDAESSVMNVENAPVGNDQLVSPQRVSVQLRPGQPQSFRITVNKIRNSPLDLYFVLDQSFSMRDDLVTFKALSESLFERIRNVTTNFQVGMGLFVDKPIAPFISENTEELLSPCPGCTPPYGFRHILNLTTDQALFQDVLSRQQISANVNAPEGGLDALLQAAVCNDIIGWREDSLRMVFHVSDNVLAIAGDGKIAGIVHPVTRQCLLVPVEDYFQYNDSILYDYPSLSMIDSIFTESNTILVFATVDDASILGHYEAIQSQYSSVRIGNLTSDSSNIIDIIETIYSAVTENIAPQSNQPDGINIDFVPICPNVMRSTCVDVAVDQMVSFDVLVTASDCNNAAVRGSNFTITVPGFGTTAVELTGICECPCSATPVPTSSSCSDVGTLRCGSCECPIDRAGDNCQCTTADARNPSNTNDCGMGPNNLVCSGPERGSCLCNKCNCLEPFFGDNCECDDQFCELDSRNLLCGGPSQGTCGCDGCTCLNGWSGASCNCTPAEDRCRANNNLICSNQGECQCNQCNCNEGFSGQFCQECTADPLSCPNPACRAYADCVVCAQSSQGTGNLDCNSLTCGNITKINPLTDEERLGFTIEGSVETATCVTQFGSCTFRYFVGTSSGGAPPIVFEQEVCREDDTFPAWIIIVIILGVLLLIGILVLIGIRIFLELRYRYEYQQWLKEKDTARFGQQQNPIYHSATTDVNNPIYDQKKRQRLKEEAEADEKRMSMDAKQ